MPKIETITPKELKKLMKLSIAIDVELGFYLALHQRTLTIDKSNNWAPNKTKLYRIATEHLNDVFTLLNAYAKLHRRRLSLR